MKTLKSILLVTVVMVVLMMLSSPAFAQGVAGKWEGELNYGIYGVALDSTTYDWTFKKWSKQASIYKMVVELKHLEDEKFAGDYSLQSGTSAPGVFELHVTFNDPAFKGETFGRLKSGSANPCTMELTLVNRKGKNYLEGKWRRTNTAAWEGVVSLLQTEGGDAAAAPDPPAADPNAAPVEENETYVLHNKNGKTLHISEGKEGIRSSSGGSDEQKGWKFVHAPGKYARYYRIIPAGKDDHCLEVDLKDGSVHVRAIEDKDSGEQYWSLEKEGEFFFLKCLGAAGTQVLDNDNEESGNTIIRRKEDDATSQMWKVEKR